MHSSIMRLLIHLGLFLLVAFAIVLLSSLFSEPDDAKALRGLPRRLAVFVVGCGILAAIMLALEHTFASVD